MNWKENALDRFFEEFLNFYVLSCTLYCISNLLRCFIPFSPGINSLRRYGSETSITDSMSVVSGPQLSDGRSSMISITQGSYVPESYLTDGYDSEPYFTSIGSSASQAAFQRGKAPDKSKYDL